MNCPEDFRTSRSMTSAGGQHLGILIENWWFSLIWWNRLRRNVLISASGLYESSKTIWWDAWDLFKTLKVCRICGSGRLATRRSIGNVMRRRAAESTWIMEHWIEGSWHSSSPSIMMSLGHCFTSAGLTTAYAFSKGWMTSDSIWVSKDLWNTAGSIWIAD